MTSETKNLNARYQPFEKTNEAQIEKNSRVYSPMTDIIETDKEIILVADMPGVDDKSIDITLDKNVLNISGAVQEARHENYKLTYSEYRANNFSRSFVLPDLIDLEKIRATVKNGVLQLHLPKSTEKQIHKIAVKSV